MADARVRGSGCAVTARELWPLFLSMPLAVQVAIPLALVLLGLGVWTASNMAGRAVAWADERRLAPRAARLVLRRREWRARLARRGPRWWVDRRARVLLAVLERADDDLEEADQR